MKTVPPSVFKYVPRQRVDIILNERIAFTPPNRFDDGLDVNPQFKPVTDATYLRKQAKEAQRKHIKSLPRGQRPRSKQERRELRAGAVEHFRMQAQEFATHMEGQLQNRISMEFGVLCLSEVHDEDLIWKESANNHSGFVIEYETAHSSFQEMGQLVQVDYVPCRPIYDPVKGTKGFWHQKLKEKFGYEKEWRIARLLGQCMSCSVNERTIYFCPLSRAAIKAVYLGLHSDNELEGEIRHALAGATPDLYRAHLDTGASKLSFRKL